VQPGNRLLKKGTAVLKITESCAQGVGTLKLEGKILAPWIEEVRSACTASTKKHSATLLDLSGVSFVDLAGARLLHELVASGIRIVTPSRFVAELLHTENP
jgi:anti-anti-sigma regulatory factor